jgi:hypothetical protein
MPSLPPQLIFATVTEIAMVLMSCLLVVQPESIFSGSSQGTRRAATYAGLVTLCLTFCWSVIFGIVLALNNLALRV